MDDFRAVREFPKIPINKSVAILSRGASLRCAAPNAAMLF
jgi:hypothetical protein